MDFESVLWDITTIELNIVGIHGLWGKTMKNLSRRKAR
jgi:hypothetical protein